MRIKSFLINLFSITSWIEFIHKKRLNKLIYCINKTVRKQKKDPLSIPILIINYNRLDDLKKLITFLIERNHKNIVVIDNKSTYQPLINYYKEVKDIIKVERLSENYGHLVFWRNSNLYRKYGKGYYIVTDSDILPNDELPSNYVEYLRSLLDKHKEVEKVGFALKIDDIPNSYPLKEKVLKWEKPHWQNAIGVDLYLNELDTTFAIYPPYYRFSHITEFYKAIRVAGRFTAKHMGWYTDPLNLSDEEIFYIKTSKNSNSWKIDENGNFNGSDYYK